MYTCMHVYIKCIEHAVYHFAIHPCAWKLAIPFKTASRGLGPKTPVAALGTDADGMS